MVSLQNITRRYGRVTALDGVSLEIGRGEFFGLLGPNGAGKSTLMALISGLSTPDSGDLSIAGQPHSARPQPLPGFVPQTIALYGDLSAENNLRFFGELHGLRGAELRERIAEVLGAVHLTDRRHDAVKTFSGGMQRRLNLAAALLHRPQLLLCDEPTAGVDAHARNAIFDYLESLNRAGLTIIYSTHYMEEATRLCTRIGIIDHGRIRACGTQAELLAMLPWQDEITFPASPATSALTEQLRPHGTLLSGDGTHRFHPMPGFRLSAFFALTESLGLPAHLFTHQRPGLEALFLHLTGHSLRD